MKNTATIHADMNEILFADRNQEYGAYQIRKAYPDTVMNAFYITASVAISLVLLMFFLQRRPMEEIVPPGKQAVTLTEVNLPNHPPVKPKTMPVAPVDKPDKPKTPKKKLKGMNTKKFDKIKPAAIADPDATMAADSLFKDKQPGKADTDSSDSKVIGGDPNGSETGDPVVDTPCLDCPDGDGEGTPYPDFNEFHAGEMPIPTNLGDIRKQIGYPAPARNAQLEGQVTYRILVDENGRYLRHMVLKSSHPFFDKACEKHLNKLTFQPGKMGDQPVPVWVVLPFKFKLMR